MNRQIFADGRIGPKRRLGATLRTSVTPSGGRFPRMFTVVLIGDFVAEFVGVMVSPTGFEPVTN